MVKGKGVGQKHLVMRNGNRGEKHKSKTMYSGGLHSAMG